MLATFYLVWVLHLSSPGCNCRRSMNVQARIIQRTMTSRMHRPFVGERSRARSPRRRQGECFSRPRGCSRSTRDLLENAWGAPEGPPTSAVGGLRRPKPAFCANGSIGGARPVNARTRVESHRHRCHTVLGTRKVIHCIDWLATRWCLCKFRPCGAPCRDADRRLRAV